MSKEYIWKDSHIWCPREITTKIDKFQLLLYWRFNDPWVAFLVDKENNFYYLPMKYYKKEDDIEEIKKEAVKLAEERISKWTKVHK